MSKVPMVLLPDIFTDHRLLEPQRRAFANLRSIDWLPLAGDTPLGDYTVRCAQQWIESESAVIRSEQAYVLGGIGLGGCIAIEVAFLAHAQGKPPAMVLLVGGCRSWREIPGRLVKGADFLGHMPATLARWLSGPMLYAANRGREPVQPDVHQLLENMMNGIDWKERIRQARMFSGWRRDSLELEQAPFPIHHLHGRLDRFIPAPSAKMATLILDGGHWINLTHAAAVNNWIEAIVRDWEVCGRAGVSTSVKTER